VPAHDDAAVAIACGSLEPLLAALHEKLASAGLTAGEAVAIVAEAYVAGHRDGARYAVGEIAPVAAAHGMCLRLGPGLRDDVDESEHVRQRSG
jgi:hypothetical protein